MSKKKKIWIFAGESSGDMYGAQLGEEMRRIAAARGEDLELSGMGGKAMIAFLTLQLASKCQSF